MSKVWLITGSGSGLGRSIAKAALEAGNRVVATARNPMQLTDFQSTHGDRVRIAQVDVTNEEQGRSAVDRAVAEFGRLDVLVNNAGYGDTQPFEQIPSEDFRRLIDTCFFGVVYLTRAAIPVMRKQRCGHILHISSTGGRFATPGNAAYHASKWAVGGFTEAVAAEIAPFGVKMTALEPGGMRTAWGQRAFGNPPQMLSEYQFSVGKIIEQLQSYWGHEGGDPDKVAQVVLRIADVETLPAHLLLGAGSIKRVRQIEETRMADAERWSAVSDWIDFAETGPMPPLPTS